MAIGSSPPPPPPPESEAALARLARGVAHDLRNVVHNIDARAQLLLRQLADGSPAAREAAEIARAARFAAALTREVLDHGRSRGGASETFDVNALLLSCRDMLESLVGGHAQLVYRLAPEGLALRGNPTALERVLVNLVVNARDAAMPGGCICIETSRRLTAGAATPVVLLAVSDDGAGMDAHTLARIFDPYFTSKPRGKGTGLGMSVVRELVAADGGTLDVASTPGAGTTVLLAYPETAGAPGFVARGRGREGEGSQTTVLVVDDCAESRSLLTDWLTPAGFRVLQAGSSAEALQVIGESGTHFDVALVDWILGDGCAADLARRLRATRPQTPLVIMSGLDEASLREEVTDAGPVLFLHKPFRLQRLTQVLRRIAGTEPLGTV